MLSELLSANRSVLQKTNSYMLPRLDKIISMVTCLENNVGHEYFDAFKRTHMRKGSYLMQAGSVCRHLWFLEKGIARVFVCRNGAERNQHFFFPSEIIDTFGQAGFQAPSRTCIQLLENAVVYSIARSRLDELAVSYPLIADIEKLLRNCHANWVEERLLNIQFLTAQEHYQYLMATQPYMISHVSLYHVALYLNITPQSLSRIRTIAFTHTLS